MTTRRLLIVTLPVLAALLIATGVVIARGPESPSAAPVLSPALQAAGTNQVAVQGVLSDAAGKPLDGTFDVTFRIFGDSSGGAALFTEAHSGVDAVAVDNGLFDVRLGELTAGGVPSDVFDDPDTFLEVQVGADTPMSPRLELGSVPYAITASNLSLPFERTITGGLPGANIFSLTYLGTDGRVGNFEIQSLSNPHPALRARTSGSGAAVDARNSGLGRAGFFTNSNTLNDQPAIFATTTGAGPAVRGSSIAGPAAVFTIGVPSNSNPALEASTLGTGPAGTFNNNSATSPALQATNNGLGPAIKASGTVEATQTGAGLFAGNFAIDNPSSGATALVVSTNGPGPALFASGQTGPAGTFINNSGPNPALRAINNGLGPAIKASGGVEATEYVYDAPQTRYYTIPASAFRPKDTTTPYINGGFSLKGASSGEVVLFTAPVHLPHGAVITQFQAIFRDDSTDSGVVVIFRSIAHSTGSVSSSQIALVTTTALSASGWVALSRAVSVPVDNQNNSYIVTIAWFVPSPSSEIEFRSARITYTVDRPLP